MTYNILWITCDEMRASATTTGRFALPAFERMAREGSEFTQCHVQVPKCIPMRGQFLTGRYPHADGLRTMSSKNFSGGHFMMLRKETPSLLRWLKDAGYALGITGKNHILQPDDVGDVFEELPKIEAKPVEYEETREEWTRAYFGGRVSSDYDPDSFRDSVNADRMIQFLETHRDQPFFALCDFGEPHPPYKEWPQFADDIPLESVPLPPRQEMETAPEPIRAWRDSHKIEALPDEDRRRILRSYWSLCRYADQLVKRLLDTLDRLDLADKTLVILGADHGDFVGAHGCYEKWDTALYDCITHVPLLMRLPGVVPAGERFDGLVEGIDIAPTTLSLLGMPIPPSVHGQPLLADGAFQGKDAVFSQGGVEPEGVVNPGLDYRERIWPEYFVKQETLIAHTEALLRAHMVRTKTHKLIYRLSRRHELYDLENDPNEQENRYADPALTDVQRQLEARLLQFFVRYQNDQPQIHEIWA